MEREPKILIVSVDSWNNKLGGNTWESLLEGTKSENVASICCREELSNSPACDRYFIISENRIIKSVFNRKIKTGYESNANSIENTEDVKQHNELYKKFRKKRRYIFLFARELVWKLGKWKTKELDEFIDSFKPDIVLHSMEGYIHVNRITEYVIKRTGAKAIGYIWDDNFTYKQHNNLGFKILRYFQRKSLKKLAKLTDEFFAISKYTKEEADEFFNIDCKILTKPLNTIPIYQEKEYDFPIHILYTGNLLIGRDKSLLKLIESLKVINKDKIYFKLDVYTQTQFNQSEMDAFNTEFSVIHQAIPQADVLQKQKECDILLFLEDIDGSNSKVARLSFSTKITDYLSSGKPVIAMGNSDVAPIKYFRDNNIAIVIDEKHDIITELEKIISDSKILNQFAKNACNVGLENHDKEKIINIFNNTICKVFEKQ